MISVHLLRQGLCHAYVAGDPQCFDAALIQSTENLGEPTAFGHDAGALRTLLRSAGNWWCVNVPVSLAPGLGKLYERVRYYGDIYHTLTRPASVVESSAVRLLTSEDLPLLELAPTTLRGSGFESPRNLLSEGIVAGAIISGKLVAIAFTSALTDRHADIGVATLEGWRNRGFATAVASLAVRQVQGSGRTPVWSAGEDNFASLRVARKLGFEEKLRRTYVIPDASSSHRAAG